MPKYLPRSLKLLNFALPKRKDAGVVDRDGLENRCTLTGTQGSNPCLSATFKNAEDTSPPTCPLHFSQPTFLGSAAKVG